ncbi:MAG: MarR family transcriptional regulator [Sphingomonadales bacterium]|nr:MarR family transcriptional regulator [Sphingomonadales bacterium]
MTDNRLVLQQFLPYRLVVTATLVSEAVARAYADLFGLTIPEWRVIAITAEEAPVTQAGIGAVSRMDKVTVSRAAIALVERGLIERQPNPEDKRSHLLALSDAGRAMYEAIAPKALAIEAAIFGQFTPAELETLRGLLARIDATVLAGAVAERP